MMKFSHHLYSTIRHFNSQVFFYIKENLIVEFTKKLSIFFALRHIMQKENNGVFRPRVLFFLVFLLS